MDKKHDASIHHRSLTGRPLLGSLAVLLALAVVVALNGRSGLPAIAVAQEALLDPVAVVNEVGPAVVTVLNKQREEHLLLPATEEVAGSGSGFFLDEQGHIVTNSHVVADGDAFEVILADGSARQATLVGEPTPSATWRSCSIEGDLCRPWRRWATRRRWSPGSRCWPSAQRSGSFTNTVTGGIVSAIGRSLARTRPIPACT